MSCTSIWPYINCVPLGHSLFKTLKSVQDGELNLCQGAFAKGKLRRKDTWRMLLNFDKSPSLPMEAWELGHITKDHDNRKSFSSQVLSLCFTWGKNLKRLTPVGCSLNWDEGDEQHGFLLLWQCMDEVYHKYIRNLSTHGYPCPQGIKEFGENR